MNKAVLSLGSNVGKRLLNLQDAIVRLEESSCELIRKSSVYETAPWGNRNQPSFYNQVIWVQTMLEPETLLDRILSIEKKMGRERNTRWEPRTIDIDVLFFNDEIIHSGSLDIPHRHLHERRFVLVPLAELMPDYIHPELKKSIATMLTELKDDEKVEKLKTVPQ